MNTRSKGFTLVELLVVIGIVGILLAITLVAINPARQFKQANNAKRSADVNTILNSITQYKVDMKGLIPTGMTIPTTATNFASDGTATVTSMELLCAALKPTYIAALPTDPTAVGAIFTDCDNFNLGYSINTDASNLRITVSAPLTESIDGGTATIISVSR